MERWLTSKYHGPSSCPDRTAQLQKVHVHVVHNRFEEERHLNIEDLRGVLASILIPSLRSCRNDLCANKKDKG
jgi:hypothetical protein